MNITFLTLFALATVATAQQQVETSPAPVPTDAWHTPFAYAPEAAGAWAFGPDYKVVIDDGATFHPVLGTASSENLPLAWRTEAVRLGGVELIAPIASRPAMRLSGHRAELDHGAVVEVYEARREGVEQLFVVSRPPQPITADLEVVGAIGGPLRTSPRAPAHAAMDFRDASGRGIVTYGAATAIDAVGRRLPLATGYADGRISITVPAAWLADAAWPVTIDPLLARSIVGGTTGQAARSIQVVRSRSSGRVFVGEARQSAAIDWDLLVRVFDADWNQLGTAFSEASTLSTPSLAMTITEAQDRLVIAYGREAFLQHDLRVYFQPAGSVTPNLGAVVDVPRPANTHDSEPSLGGSPDRWGFLAFRRDSTQLPGNSAQSRVVGLRVDTQAQTLGPVQNLHLLGGANYDAERPSVSSYSETGGWVVAWQEYNYDNAGDDWDLVGCRIGGDGAAQSGGVLGHGAHWQTHKLSPHIDGSGSRFGVAYVTRTNSGDKPAADTGDTLWIQRVNWPSGGAVQVFVPHWIDASPTSDVKLGRGSRAVAYDFVTDSLWGVAWARVDAGAVHAARFGYDAYVAESVLVDAPASVGSFHSPSLCFDDTTLGFRIAYGSSGIWSTDPSFGRKFVHGAASAVAGAPSCAGSAAVANSGRPAPFIGSEFFGVSLQGGRANAATVLLVGVAAASLPLPVSLPGCLLLVDPNRALVVIPVGVSDASGECFQPLPIPSRTRNADLYWQFVQFDGLALWSSAALRTLVR